MAKVLRTVTDRFSLFNNGRKIDANTRKYAVASVQRMIENARTQERLRLGESYGFWGHQPRQRANKLDIGETEVIMINGKPVVVENVPSNVTKELFCDDDGIVTHTQEVLDTPTGRIVDAMINSGRGGWSWATGGREVGDVGYANSYHGMDFVLQPNYISLDHPAMMLESIGEDTAFFESMNAAGLDNESALNAIKLLESNSELALVNKVSDLELELMMMESVSFENQQLREKGEAREKMLLEACNSMPIFMTEEQKEALCRMESEADVKLVQAMFESINNPKMKTLPLGGGSSLVVPSTTSASRKEAKNNLIDFGRKSTMFS